MATMKHIENYSDKELCEMGERDIERLIISEARRAGIVVPKEPTRPSKPCEPESLQDLHRRSVEYTIEHLRRGMYKRDEINGWDWKGDEDAEDAWLYSNNPNYYDLDPIEQMMKESPHKPTKGDIARHDKAVKEYNKDIKEYNKAATLYEEAKVEYIKIGKQYENTDYNVRDKIYMARENISILDECVPKYVDYLSIAKGDKDMAYNFMLYTNPEVKNIKDFRLKVMEHVLDSSM